MPSQMDAISMLKADHEKVRGLLSQLEHSTERSGSKREALLQKIAHEVEIHTAIEEEIFYPAYRDAVKKKEDRKLYQEALEEHHVVELVMPEIEETDPGTEVFSAKAKVLKEVIEHHAEEEEKEMFKRAQKVFEKEELRELGQKMQARKEELEGLRSDEDEEQDEQDEQDERGGDGRGSRMAGAQASARGGEEDEDEDEEYEEEEEDQEDEDEE